MFSAELHNCIVQQCVDYKSIVHEHVHQGFLVISGLDPNPDDEEEKQRLIAQVLERQNTLDGNNFIVLLFC